MLTLTEQVLKQAAGLPEGMPISARDFLHLGTRAAVDQVLSRSARKGKLLRIGRGLYVFPVESRWGLIFPPVSKIIAGLALRKGEVIVPHAARAANALGLTTQVPAQLIYLTSGPNRKLRMKALVLEFRHAPEWQLLFPGRITGDVLRILAWSGEGMAGDVLQKLRPKLTQADIQDLASVRPQLPTWMAQEISSLLP